VSEKAAAAGRLAADSISKAISGIYPAPPPAHVSPQCRNELRAGAAHYQIRTLLWRFAMPSNRPLPPQPALAARRPVFRLSNTFRSRNLRLPCRRPAAGERAPIQRDIGVTR